MGYGFFRKDDGPHEDRDYLSQIIGAVKLGVFFANVCVYPFFLVGKIFGAAADRRAAEQAANGQPQPQATPPPRSGPPPNFGQQAPPPPPPPPPPPTPADPLEKFRIILGVKPGANKEEIKKRYRFLCRLCHPDKVDPDLRDQAGDEFKKLNEAYTVLYAVAPDAPPKPRPQPQSRPTEATRPRPEAAKPKPEPERPRQARTENPPPQNAPAKDQSQPKTATMESKPAQPGRESPQNFEPKYF